MATATVYSGSVAYATGKFGQGLASAVLSAGSPSTGSSGWTLEAWGFYASKDGATRALFGWGSRWLGVNGDGRLAGAFGGTGFAITPNAWHHFAITGDGGTVRIYVDGAYIGETNDATLDVSTIYIGGWRSTSNQWLGIVDEVRVSAGRRYTNDFTVPSSAFTSDSTTVGLWHLDGTLADSANAFDSGGGSTTPAPGGGGSSGGGSTTPPAQGVSFTASTVQVPNPDQGWFQYTETHYNADGSGHVPLNATTLANARTTSVTGAGGNTMKTPTVVFRYFYIEKYKNVDTIDQAYLDLVTADLNAIRTAGCKAVIRFAYYNQSDSDSDAPPARVMAQVNQLAPVINAAADIIHVMQAGFIGSYGEWYYTNNWGDRGTLSGQNLADRNALIARLLQKIDSRIFIALRYLGTRQAYLGTSAPNPGGDAARLAIHNDAFLSPYGDYGTYTTFSSLSESANRDYMAAMSGLPIGMESASNNPPTSDYSNAAVELQKYHWSYLNPKYHPDVVGNWGQSNIDTVGKMLGHRLRLVSASIPSTAAAGQPVTVAVVLANDGWTSAVRNRPVNLILDNGSGQVVTTALPIDIRSIAPGQQVTVSAQVTVSTAGTYQSFLALPDPSASIASRPEYAIQLANTGIWNSSTGRHALGSPMTVGGSSSARTTTSSGSLALVGAPTAGLRGATTARGTLAAQGVAATPVVLKRVTKLTVNNVVRVVRLTTVPPS